MTPVVHAELDQSYGRCLKYTWLLLSKQYGLKTSKSRSQISVGLGDKADIQISELFLRIINQKGTPESLIFDKEPVLLCENGKPDYLGTCFYMLNSLQEYQAPDSHFDDLGRFRSEHSYQIRFNCVREDLVKSYFEKLIRSIPQLRSHSPATESSKVFLSHDIDMISGAVLQEGKAVLKRLSISLLLKTILHYFLQGPSYRDMSRIMDIHDEYDVRSTFFWLVEKGSLRSSPNGNRKIPQADYNILSRSIRSEISKIEHRGFENGLHKSFANKSFDEEIEKLGIDTVSNRNHYLRIKLPKHFIDLENSKIKLDFSLGLGDHYGFRNSYGHPFIPFDLEENKPFSFLEVPLNIMDTTFKFHQKKEPKQAKSEILNFLDKHRENCTISILWHNDMFSPVKNPGWLNLYREILDYCRQNNIRSTTQKDLLKLRSDLLTFFRNNSL